MKRLYMVLLTAAMTALVLSACASQNPVIETQPDTTPALFTLAPGAADADTEWAAVDCELALLDESAQVYAEAAGFDSFAMMGTADGDCRLVFRCTDELSAMLASLDEVHTWTITLDGEDIGEAEPSDSFDTFTVAFGDYSDMCEIATRIRGL